MSTDTTGSRRVAVRLAGAVAALLIGLAATPAAAADTAAPPPAAEQPTWAMPQDGDLLRGFIRSRFNERNGVPQQLPAPDGRPGLRFELKGGDQRSELEPQLPAQSAGTVQWYSYRSLLAQDFPTGVDTWQVLLQWHHEGDSGSPPVAVEVRSNRLEIAAEGKDYRDLGPVAGGTPIDLTLRIAFERGAGTVDVWRDGRPVLQGYRPPGGTMIDASDYLKVGYYRDTAITQFGRFWLQDLRAGPTRESVRTAEDAAREAAAAAAAAPQADGPSPALLWASSALLVLVLVLLGASLLGRRRRSR